MHDHCYEYETHLTLMHVSKYIYSFDFTIIISCFFAGHQESLLMNQDSREKKWSTSLSHDLMNY